MVDYTHQLEQLVGQLERIAAHGAIATPDIAGQLSRISETLVDNAVLKGAPVPDLAVGEDPVVQEATPGR